MREVFDVEIKMVQCPNGHYYNAALHSKCPECGGSGLGHTEPVADVSMGGKDKFPKTEPLNGGGSGTFQETVNVSTLSEDASEHSDDHIQDCVTPPNGADPAVGWIVCIEGPARGIDYRLHSGYNYIGSYTGDIRIQGDMEISRKDHALIAYDGSERVFYIGPAGGRELIKVNGKTVITAAELKSYDIITIGGTKLMFVALCGEGFDWNDRNGLYA